MAIDKYSGLSQSDKFYARYGKSVGHNAVKRQQLHLAAEKIKSDARAAAQLPNYAASGQKTLLSLPKLSGGFYETTIQNVTKKEVSNSFVNKMLRKIANDPNFNWRAADLTPEQIAAVESKLEEISAKKATKTAEKAIAGNLSQPIGATAGAASSAGATASSAASKTANLPAVINKTTKETPKGFLGGLVDSLKSFAKTKKGKIGLAAAALAAVVAGGVYLYNRNKDHDIPISDSNPINDLAESPVNGTMTANGPYTVAKGDNIWCIARSHLMELHKGEENYKPTDVEILQRTEEIMKLNNLEYEKDCYRVIIQPNQTLKLVA